MKAMLPTPSMGGEVTMPYGREDPSLAPGESMRGVDASMPMSGSYVLDANDSVKGGQSSKFSLPVDAENKATVIRLWSFAHPHMSAFHLAWVAFFISFCSTFMAAPLMPVIREDLNLTKTQIGNANAASVAGTVFFRLLMGAMCDSVGPRKAYGLLMILVSFPCFAMTMVTSYEAFITCRCAIGFSLASFVSTQYWTTQMFTPKIVGGANAITAGWGNLGGGVTHVVSTIMFTYFTNYGPYFRSWRQCYFAPGLLHLLCGVLILFYGQDGPNGNQDDVVVGKSKGVSKEVARRNFIYGVLNYRMWIFTITYGFCFGVELVIDNILGDYYFSQFNMNLIEASHIASYSGLMNVCSRASGGFISDLVARRYGMRGRLWWLWAVQSAAGGLCLAMGFQTEDVGKSIACMVLFSWLMQAACGATFGVVPFISKRSLGTVSGFVGAGGNTIAAIITYIFFTNTQQTYPESIRNLGITIMGFTLLITGCHFPMWGSMFFGPRESTIVAAGVLTPEEAYYTREYTAEEKEQGLDMPAKLFAANTLTERSKHGSNAALAQLDEKTTATAA